MSTLETAALWSATSLAYDEKKIGAAGLSVRQRKLLALLAQPSSVHQLSQSIALPSDEVVAALERFARLGLAKSDEPQSFNPMQTRMVSSMPAPPSRMPLYIGVAITALALVAAATWLLRGGSTSSTPNQISPTASAPPKAPAPATGSGDTTNSALPRPGTQPTTAASPATTAASPLPVSAATSASAKPATAAPTPQAPLASSKATATNAPAVAVNPAAAQNVAAPATATPASTATTAAPLPPAIVPTPTTVAPPTAAPVAVAPAVTATPPPAPVAAVAAAPAITAASAAARPAPAAAREIKLVSRVDPGFPRGIDAERGTVRARLQVDARGAVTGVDIVESVPPRVFDRVVRSALQQWRYEPTGDAFTVMAEISFNR